MTIYSQRLDSVANILMGQAPPGDAYNSNGEGWPLLAGAGDFKHGRPAAKKFTLEAARICIPGDIVIGVRASIGEKVVADREYCLGRGVAALRARPEVHDRYLWHWLSATRKKLEGKGKDATFKQVTKEDISELEIPLPPLEEQRRIAAILDKAMMLGDLSANQIQLLEETEKHLFFECLGTPFPGETKWPVCQLGEIGTLERGVSRHRPRNDPSLMNGPYPFIQTGDVAGCRGKITSFSATYSEKGLAQSRLWPAGTLCITIAANIAKTGIIDFDACFPDSVVGFRSDNPALITYVQCWIAFLQSHIEEMAPESAQKNINLEILRGLSLPSPPENKLQDFHDQVLALRNTRLSTNARASGVAELSLSLQAKFFSFG